MQVVIIGAGIAGMFAALRLAESGNKDIENITILEQNAIPGGLIQSVYEENCFWDKGVFKFFGSNAMYELFPELFQEVTDFVTEVYIEGQISDMKSIMTQALKELPVSRKILFLFDYAYSYLATLTGLTEKSMFTWLRYRITRVLYGKTHLEIYLRKLQGLPTKELSSKIGWERVSFIHHNTRPGFALKMLLKISAKKGSKPRLITYPFDKGVGAIMKRLAEHCESKGINIEYSTKVRKIRRPDDSLYELDCDNSEEMSTKQATHIISTIPVDKLVEALGTKVSVRALDSVKNLKFMNIFLIFYSINLPKIKHQFYVLYSFEEHHKWKRILSTPLQNGTCTVVVELTYNPEKESIDESIVDEVESQIINEIKLFSKDDILMRKTDRVSNGYPMYKNGFDKAIEIVLKDIESETLVSTGRQGAFKYLDSPGAIQCGRDAADRILANRSD